VHLGLGEAIRVETLEVRWPDGAKQSFEAVDANALYELTAGDARPTRITPWGAANASEAMSRDQLSEFWRRQRAAMDAMKVDGDLDRAILLFEQALELDPDHFDSLYYLGNCLAERGEVERALGQFAELTRVDPQSHRAYKRWGTLRAVTARDMADLDEAVESLDRAFAINPEETGVSLVLGEVELMRGNTGAARQRLEWVVRSNPQSGEAFFVLAYLAWRDGDDAGAVRRLEQAAGTREEDWKPAGAVAEGEVRHKMHVEAAPFVDLFEAWDGTPDPESALGPLHSRLAVR
jgi:tetratricopeptide (TPR) repeat protein